MADPLQQSVVPSVLANDPRFGPMARLSERLSQLDLSTLLVYLIDLVGADLLPLLAEQFHVMGDEGWLLANTDEQRRLLIKQAIELHRYKGTVWAVKNVFGVLNVGVEVVEWWQQQQPAAPYTFTLTAWVNDNLLPGRPTLSTELYARLRRMVDMVKPARAGYGFKVGVRLDQPTLALASTQHTRAIARSSAVPVGVQPTGALNPARLANAARPLSIIRIFMEAQ